MKNALFFLLGLLILASHAAAIEDINCFDYYKFGTGLSFGNLMTEKAYYSPGDLVNVSYSLLCQTDVPIVEGSVWVQIFYEDVVEGEQMIDEFPVSKDISMQYGDELPQEFTWKISLGAKPGKYSVKTYFIVGYYFNLAGLTILPYGPPGVPGELTYFEVLPQDHTSRIFFSKNATTVNEEPYEFAAPAIIRFIGPHSIKTKIVNEGSAKDVRIRIETFEWANVAGAPIDSVDKTLSLSEDSSQDVEYTIPRLKSATYEVVFSAVSGAYEKTLMKMRIPETGVKGRFIYAGFDRFPLIKDDTLSLFMCYSGSTDYTTFFNGTGTVSVVDAYSNVVYSEKYGPFEVTASPPQGKKFSFKIPRNLTKAVLKLDLYDDSGTLQDNVTIDYDITKFASMPGEYSLSLSKEVYSTDEGISYMAKCFDVYENPLKCRVQLALTDEAGDVFYDYYEENFSGSMQGTLISPGKAGKYIVTAKYPDKGETAGASFIIVDAKPAQEKKTTEAQPVQSEARYPDMEIKHTFAKRSNNPLQNPILIVCGFFLIVCMFLAAKKLGQQKKGKK